MGVGWSSGLQEKRVGPLGIYFWPGVLECIRAHSSACKKLRGRGRGRGRGTGNYKEFPDNEHLFDFLRLCWCQL